jgi:hypothetical protein
MQESIARLREDKTYPLKGALCLPLPLIKTSTLFSAWASKLPTPSMFKTRLALISQLLGPLL